MTGPLKGLRLEKVTHAPYKPHDVGDTTQIYEEICQKAEEERRQGFYKPLDKLLSGNPDIKKEEFLEFIKSPNGVGADFGLYMSATVGNDVNSRSEDDEITKLFSLYRDHKDYLKSL